MGVSKMTGTPYQITTGDKSKESRHDKRNCDFYRKADDYCCKNKYKCIGGRLCEDFKQSMFKFVD